MDQLSPLTIAVQPPVDRTRTLTVAGEIDLAATDQLTNAVKDAVTSTRLDRIILDLAAVSFLDSMGIHTLVTARDWAARHGVTLQIANARDTVERVLAMTGVLTELTE